MEERKSDGDGRIASNMGGWHSTLKMEEDMIVLKLLEIRLKSVLMITVDKQGIKMV